jgi:hypothetical protein
MGSGRRNQGGKDTTNNFRALDVRRLQQDGCLNPGKSFTFNWFSNGMNFGSIQIYSHEGHIILNYRHQRKGEDWKTQRYPVNLDWSDCHYGGQRAWFRCPTDGCNRRVALLYLGNSGIFGCRHCYKLTFACQRESKADRLARRADKIRDKLDWQRGILNPNGTKPKGMHWKTYWRLWAKHDDCVDVALLSIAKRFGFLEKMLE